jgi:hypothetical protein
MKFWSICLWIILGFLYFSVIGAAPARAANNVLNPFHCDFNKDSKADVLWRNITKPLSPHKVHHHRYI